MRRDQFTVAVQNADDDPPTLDIVYDGPVDDIDRRLTDDGEPLEAADLDAAFRLLAPPEDATDDTRSNSGAGDSPSDAGDSSGSDADDSSGSDADDSSDAGDDTQGVFSLTHRLTGSYLFEANAGVEDVRDLVAAAREVDDDARYRIRIRPEDGDTTVYEMSALFVYDSEGELLRQRSLIPSGVEL